MDTHDADWAGWIYVMETIDPEFSMLTEKFNGHQPSQDEVNEMGRAAGRDAVLLTGERWEPLLELSDLSFDRYLIFNVSGVPVGVSVDAAGYDKDGRFVVVDIRPSVEPVTRSPLINEARALYVVDKLGIAPENTQIWAIPLDRSTREVIAFDRAQLSEARARIREGWSLFQTSAQKEMAVARPEGRKCAACNSATICDEAAREMRLKPVSRPHNDPSLNGS